MAAPGLQIVPIEQPSVAHTTYFVRIQSDVDRIPDQAYRGVYRVDLADNDFTKEQEAHVALNAVLDMVQLNQPNLNILQVYDYNGHEVAWPVVPEQDFELQCTITRVQVHPVLVQAARTTKDLFRGT